MTAFDVVQRPDRDTLGEAAVWDETSRRLYWVDIVGKRVHRLDPETGEITSWDTPGIVTAAVPSTRGDLIIPMDHAVHRLDLQTGATTPFAQPPMLAGARCNETRTDPQGRLWVGTMQNNIGPNGEALQVDKTLGEVWCVDADGECRRMLDGIRITNAFGWSPDGTRYYTADTPRQLVWSFRYDPDGPALHDRQLFVEGGEGNPDGSTVDEDGCVWIARWGGSRVIRYTPDGRLDRQIELPARQPSCCALGGPDRRTLYVTSARQELEAPGPEDGALFAVRVDTPGLEAVRFRG